MVDLREQNYESAVVADAVRVLGTAAREHRLDVAERVPGQEHDVGRLEMLHSVAVDVAEPRREATLNSCVPD